MRRFLSLWMAVILVAAGLVASAPAVVSADPTYMCFPTCEEGDARFLVLDGTDLSTFTEDKVQVEFSSPSNAPGIEIGIYDGDTGGTWDRGTGEIEFVLYADPKADGSGTTPLATWSSLNMTDKAWFSATVSNNAALAQAPSGHFFYKLIVSPKTLGPKASSAFKLRTDGVVMMSPDAFSFIAPFNTYREGDIIYPQYRASRDLATTTYNGMWDFYVSLFESATSLEFWDGDFDHGTYSASGGVDLDTNDLDTPDEVPAWALDTGAVPEGVAFVPNCETESSVTSCPADDSSSAIWVRAPAVQYRVVAPGSVQYANNNPSGNAEWERFRISTLPDNPSTMDYQAASLPPGAYHIIVEGLDLGNLNAFRFNHWVSSVPVVPPQPYLIGDYVWLDSDGEGDQDEISAGIGDVLMNLIDANGIVITNTLTDATGLYAFEVPTGTFTVQVDAGNFSVGGPLYNYVSTTGGESQTNTVVDANILTYDFGYRPSGQGGALGALGDYVWLDANGNGVQDDGPDAGLEGVRVVLWSDSDGNGSPDAEYDERYTDATGYYAFEMLAPGAYEVRVDASTLPDDLQQTYDLDGLATPNTATVILDLGEERWDVDFGYVPPQDICLQGETDPTRVGAQILYWVNQAAGTVTIRTTLARTFEDTAYGVNSKITGWPGGGRKFKQIVTSDNLELSLYDGAGRTAMRFAMDLLDVDPTAPSGYGTLGIAGGDGFIAAGNAGDVLQVRTSISENLNNLGWRDFVNSPLVDRNYAGIQEPRWDWDLWYEATVALSAFGDSGFGSPMVYALHSSPSKTGDQTPPLEPCVTTVQLKTDVR